MFERLNKQKKLAKAKTMFIDAVDSDATWQSEAREDFLFRDGTGQWTEQEKQILQDELRPALTFNLTKSNIDLIMGLNEDNRVVYRCTPVEPTDDFLCEILNNIHYWAVEKYGFETEEDSALESASICGRGYIAVDFVPDPKKFGDIILSLIAVPVHEVHFDPASRRSDWSDAGYITWDRWLSTEDFKIRYPKYPISKIQQLIETGRSFGDLGNVGVPSEIFEEFRDSSSDTSDYARPLDLNFYDRAKRMVRLIHMEYWEVYKRFFGFNPKTGEFEEFDGKNLKAIKKNYKKEFDMEFQYEVMMDKRVKWLQFIGDEILYDDLSPLPYDGFSVVPMFAFTDVSQRTTNHFGLVRIMKDPQREVNKRWSQALNLLNNQVQPGLFAEVDAFLDLEQAKASLKTPGDVTLMNSGGLGKIQERSMPQFPNAPMQMEEFSQNIIRKITGISPDLLGQDRGRQEPGVVVRLRQQQGITLLKPLFKAHKRMRREVFKRILSIIMEFMPNEQILRVLGQEGRYNIDRDTGTVEDKETGLIAAIRNIRELEYNIQVEEAPGNMTKRTLELAAFMEMQQQGFPVEPAVIINRLDIPSSEKKRWLEYIEQQQTQAAEEKDAVMGAELEFKDRELSNDEQKTILDFLIDVAKVNQMAEKDEKKLVGTAAQIEQADNKALLDMITKITTAAAAAEKQKQRGDTSGKRKQTVSS
jgi:hypothetical protein